jgi:DNA polymerase-1
VCSGIEDLAARDLAAQLQFRGRDQILRRIRENIETVRISRQLATICCDVPIEVSPQILRYRRADRGTIHPLCRELGFASVLPDIPLTQPMLFS